MSAMMQKSAFLLREYRLGETKFTTLGLGSVGCKEAADGRLEARLNFGAEGVRTLLESILIERMACCFLSKW